MPQSRGRRSTISRRVRVKSALIPLPPRLRAATTKISSSDKEADLDVGSRAGGAEAFDPLLVEVGHHRLDAPVAAGHGDGGEGLEVGNRGRIGAADAAEAGLERVQGLVDHEPRPVQDAHAIGQGLDSGQVVGGEEDGGAAIRQLADQLVVEHAPGHHVEAEGRIVENEEIRRVPEGEGQHHRALLALREPPERDVHRHLRPLQARAHRGRVAAWIEARGEGGERGRGHGGGSVGLFGQHPDPPHQLASLAPDVVAEQPHLPRLGFCWPRAHRTSEDLPAPFRPRSA